MKPSPYCFWSVGIVVPAQNEEDTIEACIESILDSCRHAKLKDFRVVVVADGCRDLTSVRARRALGHAGELLACEARNVGTARRLGVEAVLRFFRGRAPSQIWLANTDADSTVPLDWLEVQLKLADSGTAGIAGIVRLPQNGGGAADEAYRQMYLTADDGTHAHVHGANLSVRADAYLDAGGWSHRALAEDHCLWQRLQRRGWRVCSPVTSVVVTSARLKGRAPGGFADTLRTHIEAASAPAGAAVGEDAEECASA
jgi:cellulose synthase/poly-beta-1,6-N-acetylglucosamine synthase-like glycosyltransferase